MKPKRPALRSSKVPGSGTEALVTDIETMETAKSLKPLKPVLVAAMLTFARPQSLKIPISVFVKV